jgi:AraC-like DNA-binding protein
MIVERRTYYTIPRVVQEYAIQWHQSTGKRITFPKALQDLERLGKLADECPPLPPFPEHMTPDQFANLILDLPFDATHIINFDRIMRGQGIAKESGIFPLGKDVFCFKHMPYMDLSAHSHDYFEITYIYRGSCPLLFENQKFVLNEGELCIIPPMSPHNQPVDIYAIALGIVVRKSTFNSIFGELLTHKDLVSSFLRNSLYKSTKNNYLILKTEILPQIRDIIHQLAYETNRHGPYANICSVSLLNLFLALTLRSYRDNITIYRMEDLARNHRDFPMILQYIQQHFKTVTLSSLAQVFNYSESHICRLIQNNLNQSFTAIVRSLKMARAQDYLENTLLKVSEIASLVGYESVDHFSRTFKKTFGSAPLEYRRLHQ